MLMFNNRHIFTGYLKQLLSSFNIPIKDSVEGYDEDIFKLNKTRTLKLNDNIYDSYTHEYLGDFLRFYKKQYNINLMPLYNCYSNRLCTNLLIENTDNTIIFDTSDTNYKIYRLPIYANEVYTIAIDCNTAVEFITGHFDIKNYKTNFQTYKKINGMYFNKPILLDIVKDLKLSTNDAKTLNLYIKLPATNNSSIVVLEGNYTNYNNKIFIPKLLDEKTAKLYSTLNEPVNTEATIISRWETKKNKTVINFAEINNIIDADVPLITDLQLLQFNTGISYPFADRLIEYLLGNVISSNETLADNIKRVQKVMNENGITFKYFGIWDDKIKYIVYDYMVNSNRINLNNTHDCLGFIDKDVEKYYASKNNSIANCDLYPDMYKE